MNIYSFLQIQFFVLYALLKCIARCENSYSYDASTQTACHKFESPYEFTYDHLAIGPISEEVKKLGDVEFDTSISILYVLLHFGTDKKMLLHKINNTDIVLLHLREFEFKYRYQFIDKVSKENCISRIKRRLDFIIKDGTLSEEYCKQAQKYFWIEQRVDEEMSLKVDKEKTYDEKSEMCKNKDEIKKFINVLEKGRGIKLSEEMIKSTVDTVEDFLLDVLRTSMIDTDFDFMNEMNAPEQYSMWNF
ncbi:gamete antigen 27/25, putative [Plasmodium malariae]|uniref:Gamete antigen 27/25 (G27/25) n=1 Tax=Plasmodium malariae TaxID=5858 RepID=A0A1A8XBG0_PLAMA|nr:gamete antigen 27/25, putative [Plasmodium malariae]SBT01204.1 gamete antigen 27/25 (G27/25) [Plasmodium malariae]SCP03120.1 gamete antigen 27/25, putative [Plasmodium malariae]